jgi:hypothetical protein
LSPDGTDALQCTRAAGPVEALADGKAEEVEDGLAAVLGVEDGCELGLCEAEVDPPPQAATIRIAAANARRTRTA